MQGINNTSKITVSVYVRKGQARVISSEDWDRSSHLTLLAKGWTHKETIDPVLFIQDHYQKIEDAKAK